MKIIKLSKLNCVPCQTVEKFLSTNDIKYEEHDIYEEPEVIEQYGITGVPMTLLVDDNNI
ncbi:hypothetical protein CIL03_08695 [Virgibacillus indicus]|uniref:Glutaredoxin domain-containing protein n=1 Tax=Virgibacillus indicus TaxID=2024554 RepID=A0A265NCA0_9BACI|nr:glutaredoxin domain-containing protein [Virgibacillus indicus]OZU89084.1 hypothetical protein CIL03_08695 [Virgibacillus indicus]